MVSIGVSSRDAAQLFYPSHGRPQTPLLPRSLHPDSANSSATFLDRKAQRAAGTTKRPRRWPPVRDQLARLALSESQVGGGEGERFVIAFHRAGEAAHGPGLRAPPDH